MRFRWIHVLLVLVSVAGAGIIRRQSVPGRAADIPVAIPSVAERVRGDMRTAGVAVQARAAVVIEGGGADRVLVEYGAFDPHPVASLTKIMSAAVFLGRHPDLEQLVTIQPTEYTLRGGNLHLAPHERVTIRDLLFASVMGSANNAAYALPRVLNMTDRAFVQEMNRTAVVLGLETAHFADAAGFSPKNVASAYDLARLVDAAFRQYPLIAEVAGTAEHVFTIHGSERIHRLRHSNKRLPELGDVAESKTGYLDEALFCLVLTRMVGEHRLIAVVLGHPSETGVIDEARTLLDVAERRLSSQGGDTPVP